MPQIDRGSFLGSRMRCIFCKSDSTGSRSIEHILPQSLGNKLHTLQLGVVCDGCNNFFSHGVEKPFLDAPAIERLRFYKVLENRRGRVPPVRGLILPDVSVMLYRDMPSQSIAVDVPEKSVEAVRGMAEGRLLVPVTGPMPTPIVTSRFLAKVALEALANRLSDYPEGLEYVCDEAQLDAIRDHARRGKTPEWPVHIREIYEIDGMVLSDSGLYEEVLHEFDFLVTETNEWYFVLVICGIEFTINLGGPAVEGYMRWMEARGGASPLYHGKNLQFERPAIRASV